MLTCRRIFQSLDRLTRQNIEKPSRYARKATHLQYINIEGTSLGCMQTIVNRSEMQFS